jgi:hypothetical protein
MTQPGAKISMQVPKPYWCLVAALVFHSFGVMNIAEAQVKTEHFESDVTTIIKPWTHLDFYNDPKNFQFGIISDRAGGVRPGVFLDGVNKLNLLMPEFVMSVGDFIPGNTSDREQLLKEWAEFEKEREPLKVPFFYLPGNHDINNDVMRQVWKERFGVPFYSFVYKDVLFLALDTTGEKGYIVPEYQVDYVKKALEKHSDVRWTFVFMHHPLWLYDDPGGFAEIEKALKGRKHTVIAGHTHHYLHERRGHTNYYILGTTGGGSQLRGSRYGEFDHVTLITMADEGPVMANLRLDGILPHDVTSRNDYELTRSLFNATRMPYTMLTDGQDKVTSGTLYLNFRNPSKNDLIVKADFMHGHEVSMNPSRLDFSLAPGSEKPVEIEIESTEAISTVNRALLQLAWTMGYELEGEEDLFLSGKREIALKPSAMQIIRTVAPEFVETVDVAFVDTKKGYTARYTLDGSPPTDSAKRYKQPIAISKATTISARLFNEKGQGTMTESQSYHPVPAGSGLRYRYYEGNWTRLPEFSELAPLFESVTTDLDVESRQLRADNWGMVLEGNLEIEKSGDYTFHLNSDDGCNLYLDDQLVIDNDGDHSVLELSGKAKLSAGEHQLRLEFFDSLGEAILELEMEGPGMKRQPLPFEKVSH